MVLTTHHHSDHAAGNGQIKKKIPDVVIIGGDSRVDHVNQLIRHEERWKVISKKTSNDVLIFISSVVWKHELVCFAYTLSYIWEHLLFC
jgi:glyoxylase-like metal-dependent hydrolase (beta-lactamase superfamily II)